MLQNVFTGLQFTHMWSNFFNLYPRRHTDYVSQKIVQSVLNLSWKRFLYLGNIKSKIDWGYAKEFEYSWKIMQKNKPNFYVVGTGKNHSVEYFVKKCFEYVGLNYKKYIRIDKKLFRPSKTRNLIADTSKAKRDLNFKIKTNLDDLIKIMMDAEMKKYNE